MSSKVPEPVRPVGAGVPGHPDGWAPVVYGRTQASDTWWRAVPAGFGDRAWLAEAVAAAVAHGNGLEIAPRLLLAQKADCRLVGIACMARLISATMNRDGLPGGSGGRSLYTFVGWLALPRPDGTLPRAPGLAALRAKAAAWAEPVYERWVSPAWRLPGRSSYPTEPQPPPWSESEDVAEPHAQTRAGDWSGSRVRLWQSTEAESLWACIMDRNEPAILSYGWKRSADVPRDIPADAIMAPAPGAAPASAEHAGAAVVPAARPTGTAPELAVPVAATAQPASASRADHHGQSQHHIALLGCFLELCRGLFRRKNPG
jgi:hypothetical protein